MLDNLSEEFSDFGNYVFPDDEFGAKSQKKTAFAGMVYGLKELEGN